MKKNNKRIITICVVAVLILIILLLLYNNIDGQFINCFIEDQHITQFNVIKIVDDSIIAEMKMDNEEIDEFTAIIGASKFIYHGSQVIPIETWDTYIIECKNELGKTLMRIEIISKAYLCIRMNNGDDSVNNRYLKIKNDRLLEFLENLS